MFRRFYHQSIHLKRTTENGAAIRIMVFPLQGSSKTMHSRAVEPWRVLACCTSHADYIQRRLQWSNLPFVLTPMRSDGLFRSLWKRDNRKSLKSHKNQHHNEVRRRHCPPRLFGLCFQCLCSQKGCRQACRSCKLVNRRSNCDLCLIHRPL